MKIVPMSREEGRAERDALVAYMRHAPADIYGLVDTDLDGAIFEFPLDEDRAGVWIGYWRSHASRSRGEPPIVLIAASTSARLAATKRRIIGVEATSPAADSDCPIAFVDDSSGGPTRATNVRRHGEGFLAEFVDGDIHVLCLLREPGALGETARLARVEDREALIAGWAET